MPAKRKRDASGKDEKYPDERKKKKKKPSAARREKERKRKRKRRADTRLREAEALKKRRLQAIEARRAKRRREGDDKKAPRRAERRLVRRRIMRDAPLKVDVKIAALGRYTSRLYRHTRQTDLQTNGVLDLGKYVIFLDRHIIPRIRKLFTEYPGMFKYLVASVIYRAGSEPDNPVGWFAGDKGRVMVDVDNALAHIRQTVIDHIGEIYTKYKEDPPINAGVKISILPHIIRTGASWVPLPAGLKYKGAIINVKNTDQQCFKWTILASIAYKRNPKRAGCISALTKIYNEELELGLDFSYCSSPTSFHEIRRWELDHRIGVCIWTWDAVNESISLGQASTLEKPINILLYKGHYMLISSMSRLTGSSAKHGRSLCTKCLNMFRNKRKLKKHFKSCEGPLIPQISMPRDDEQVEKHTLSRKDFRSPICIYADFEAFNRGIKRKGSSKLTAHDVCSYAYYTHTDADHFYQNNKLVLHREDAAHFLKSLAKMEDELTALEEENDVWQDADWKECTASFDHTQSPFPCHYCKKLIHPYPTEFKDMMIYKYDVVYNGKRRLGFSHEKCAEDCSPSDKIPVFFHNLSGYDLHHIIRAISNVPDTPDWAMSGIALNCQVLKTFTFGRFRFLDSMAFLKSGLGELTKNLPDSKKIRMKSFAAKRKVDFKLMSGKQIFPYMFLSDPDCWVKPTPLEPDHYYSHLSKEDADDDDICKLNNLLEQAPKLKNFGEYHDLYLGIDVMALTDVFEEFRSIAERQYKLDPTHYVSLPAFAWASQAKFSGSELHLLKSERMYKFFEDGIRGGFSAVVKRTAKANNSGLPEGMDPTLEESYIRYLDANNLYGHSMMQELPYRDFKFVGGEVGGYKGPLPTTNEEAHEVIANHETYMADRGIVHPTTYAPFESVCELIKLHQRSVQSFDLLGTQAYTAEVDLAYPEHLHKLHHDLPLAPEKMKIKKEQISKYSLDILKDIKSEFTPSEKLVSHFNPRKRYIIHHRALRYYLKMGLKVTKIHRVVTYTEKAWLKPWIEHNTEFRAGAQNGFERDFYKLMNNSTFGKTMECVRDRIKVEFNRDLYDLEKSWKKENLKSAIAISENLVITHHQNMLVSLNKAIYTGQCILDNSKILMFKFHYGTVLPKWPQARLLMTDTDSLCYYIPTVDLDGQILKDEKLYAEFDFSNLPPSDPLYSQKWCSIPGKMKNESPGGEITEFIGHRAKVYRYEKFTKTSKGKGEKIKWSAKKVVKWEGTCKGVPKATKEKDLNMEHYRDAIFKRKKIPVTSTVIRSYQHNIYTVEQTRNALSPYDDKRFMHEDGLDSSPYGYRNNVLP